MMRRWEKKEKKKKKKKGKRKQKKKKKNKINDKKKEEKEEEEEKEKEIKKEKKRTKEKEEKKIPSSFFSFDLYPSLLSFSVFFISSITLYFFDISFWFHFIKGQNILKYLYGRCGCVVCVNKIFVFVLLILFFFFVNKIL
jgi:phenylalanyl-tRNA synthetase alpha subunit